MKLYRLRIRPKSSFVTQLQSDTIFGSLCWCLAHINGDKCLEEIINSFDEGNYPFVVSSGYPEDFLPKPMAGNSFPQVNFDTVEDLLSHSKKLKRAKKQEFISLRDFNEIINGNTVELSKLDKSYYMDEPTTHNTISRETGGSLETAGLFEIYEKFYDVSHISIYMAIEDRWIEYVKAAFNLLASRGFGSGASRGKGAFEVLDFELWKSIKIPEKANAHVLLSYYVPKSNESTLGQYKTYVKYGRVGSGIHDGNPFKNPIIMMLPGAVFWGNNNNGYSLGRLIHNVIPGNSEIIHGGCALALPMIAEI